MESLPAVRDDRKAEICSLWGNQTVSFWDTTNQYLPPHPPRPKQEMKEKQNNVVTWKQCSWFSLFKLYCKPC